LQGTVGNFFEIFWAMLKFSVDKKIKKGNKRMTIKTSVVLTEDNVKKIQQLLDNGMSIENIVDKINVVINF
jgi:hypothetical protein